jgi:hypothetical protein
LVESGVHSTALLWLVLLNRLNEIKGRDAREALSGKCGRICVLTPSPGVDTAA